MTTEGTELAVDIQTMIRHLYELSLRHTNGNFRLEREDKAVVTDFVARVDTAREQMDGIALHPLPAQELELLVSVVPSSCKGAAKLDWLAKLALSLEAWRDRQKLGPLQLKKIQDCFQTLRQALVRT